MLQLIRWMRRQYQWRCRAGDGLSAGSEGFIKGGINRILLATDGDFNVGLTIQNRLNQWSKNSVSPVLPVDAWRGG